jgi:hypothetical protein
MEDRGLAIRRFRSFDRILGMFREQSEKNAHRVLRTICHACLTRDDVQRSDGRRGQTAPDRSDRARLAPEGADDQFPALVADDRSVETARQRCKAATWDEFASHGQHPASGGNASSGFAGFNLFF